MAALEKPGREQYCAGLSNQESFFSVDVEVGTPGQKFSVVADTGSNALVVPSCVCEATGRCDDRARCFTGTNRSGTFDLHEGKGGEPESMMMTYGSGTVEAVIVTESVDVDGLKVIMEDGLLLMTDQALRFPGPFEGILGLGVPMPPMPEQPPHEAADADQEGSSVRTPDSIIKDLMKRVFGAGGGGGEEAAKPDVYAAAPGGGRRLRQDPEAREEFRGPTGFLEQAHIPRFSMCFNHGADGVLLLNSAAHEGALETVGKMHWGLDFRGASVGASSGKLSLCSTDNMTAAQKTPCGLIPDSGTTNIMMPQAHLTLVLESICDGWDRCRENYTALEQATQQAKDDFVGTYGVDPFGLEVAAKADILTLVLQDCTNWMGDSDAWLVDLPPLKLHVADKQGQKSSTLALSGRSYIMISEAEEQIPVYKEIEGIGKVPVGLKKTGVNKTVCLPAFGPMDYFTQENGPVWIVGMPLFYEFTVGFEMSSPTAVSFTPQSQAPCGSCDKKAGLVDSGPRPVRWPRRVSGPPRPPSIDTTQPL